MSAPHFKCYYRSIFSMMEQVKTLNASHKSQGHRRMCRHALSIYFLLIGGIEQLKFDAEIGDFSIALGKGVQLVHND